MAIGTCVENVSVAVLTAPAASIRKRRPRNDKWLLILAGIQDEMHMTSRQQEQWQINRDNVLKDEVKFLQRSVTRRLSDCSKGHCNATPAPLNPEDQSMFRVTLGVMRVPTPTPLLVTPGESQS